MPSAVHTALSSALDALSDIAGESVSFRGATVTAVVNRDTPGPVEMQAAIDVQIPDGATILLPASTYRPRPGEVIVDGYGYHHRIAAARFVGTHWLCSCTLDHRLTSDSSTPTADNDTATVDRLSV